MQVYRRRIDRLDRRVARLLRRRYRLVRAIGLAKLRRGMQVEDPGREQRVLSRVAGAGSGGAAEYVRGVYRYIIEASRRVQERLGPGESPPADRRRGMRG
jgi:chorismate mutase